MNGLGYGVRLIASLPPLVSDLRKLGVSNLEAWLREIKPRLGDREQYFDLWTQGWYARVFGFNGREAIMNPNGNVGPDLLVRDPSTPTKDVYVEVRQFVEDYGETKRLKSAIKNGFLVLYDVRNKDAKKILDAVSGKQRQGSRLPADSSYVVALKSDKESI